MARRALEGDVLLCAQAGFHAQQAVEKAIKAVILARRGDFPFTHDIASLFDILCKCGVILPEEISRASELSAYAVEVRYPGLDEPVDPEEAREAFATATAVVAWARTLL